MLNIHTKYMKIALGLARRGVGITAPNPSVGCVIVRDEQIIATGVTAAGGRPHAERAALAKVDATGATAYVTLEPCSHYGKTPPCADALIEAAVKQVVVAIKDPFEKVAGAGIKKLQDAGIDVVVGVCQEEARQLNAGFLSVQEKGRPFVTLKLATSADGKIADKDGNSKWITGEHTRRYAHYLRATHDAIMVGIGTVLADDPELTCRLPGMAEQSPVRVVMDSNLQIPATSKLVQTAGDVPCWIFAAAGKQLDEPGVRLLDYDGDIAQALQMLAEQGITRLLVEGGSKLAASFINGGLVDDLIWMQASKEIGADGIDAIAGRDIAQLASSSFSLQDQWSIATDMVRIYSP